MAAHGRRMTYFHQWLGAQINIADMGKYADGGNDSCADEAKDHNLQMCPGVRAIH